MFPYYWLRPQVQYAYFSTAILWSGRSGDVITMLQATRDHMPWSLYYCLGLPALYIFWGILSLWFVSLYQVISFAYDITSLSRDFRMWWYVYHCNILIYASVLLCLPRFRAARCRVTRTSRWFWLHYTRRQQKTHFYTSYVQPKCLNGSKTMP